MDEASEDFTQLDDLRVAQQAGGDARMTAIPPVRRRIVGTALRRYRQDLGYSLEDAARILECDRSKISRIETGQRSIPNRDLHDLLAEYGVEKQAQETLAIIANPSGTRGWWQAYAHNLPDAYVDMIALETAAPQIMVYEAQQIPDLLQSKEYAHALADACAGLTPASQRQRHISTCLNRQDIVLGKLRPEIAVVIGETALRHMPGGPAVTRAQLAALASANSRLSQVRIQVLLPENGAHVARAAGSFTILRYAPVPGLEMVYLRGISCGSFVEDQREIAAYASAFRQLTASALTPDASENLIRQMQHETGSTEEKRRKS
jgi:transcriptional regulator with XRE-family HTH domain